MTVIMIIAVIALGALLIHRLNAQHNDRITAFHYGRSGMPVVGPPPDPSERRGPPRHPRKPQHPAESTAMTESAERPEELGRTLR